MGMPVKPVDYPNPLYDVAIQGARAPWKRMLVLRPREDGRFTLFIHPQGFCSRPFLQRWDLLFEDRDGPPARLEFTPPGKYRLFQRWSWLVVPWPPAVNPMSVRAGQNRPPLIVAVPDDPPTVPDADLLFGTQPVLEGKLDFEREAEPERGRRLVAWSCHQPYDTVGEKAVVQDHVEDVMKWYADEMKQFQPHEIWGLGDTMYADGAHAVNLVRQLDDMERWWTSPSNRERLREAYANAYRYHWSLPHFQEVTRNIPHIAMWDDHEIRDGWGSEETDFTTSGLAMHRQARLAAEDYILDLGPRLHPRSTPNGPIDEDQLDAHNAYIDGELATFIFDGRSSRRYRDCTGRIMSDAQMQDFAVFCGQVASDRRVRTLLLGIGTAVVNLVDVFEEIGSVLPDWINEMEGVDSIRDDVRDGWNAPGTRAQLRQLCGIWLWLHRMRPDVEFVIISGDIHLSNAFTFQPPGFAKPVYQITTSALTNRESAPEQVTKYGGQDTDWSTLVDMLSYVIPTPCADHFSVEGMLKGAVIGSIIGGLAGGAAVVGAELAGIAAVVYGTWRLINSDQFYLTPDALWALAPVALGAGSVTGVMLGALFPAAGSLLGTVFGGFSIGGQRNDNPVQSVKRLWSEQRNPNVLMIEQTPQGLLCTLRVFDLSKLNSKPASLQDGSLDRTIRIGIDRT
jgi:hypothetical protein